MVNNDKCGAVGGMLVRETEVLGGNLPGAALFTINPT
jgi:hypothetical protein